MLKSKQVTTPKPQINPLNGAQPMYNFVRLQYTMTKRSRFGREIVLFQL